MENLTPEGDTWHLLEAFSVSCQAQRREVIVGSCRALLWLIYKYLLKCPQAAKSPVLGNALKLQKTQSKGPYLLIFSALCKDKAEAQISPLVQYICLYMLLPKPTCRIHKTELRCAILFST